MTGWELWSVAELAIVYYFFALNATYIVLAVVAFWEVHGHMSRSAYGNYEKLILSPLAPPISVIVPAHNEEVGIALTVGNLLHLDYMRYEVIVVNDGSSDSTLEILKRDFALRLVGPERRGSLPTRPIRGVYASRVHHNLLVIDKDNGGKADALNAGLNAARNPYFCSIDADAILEPDALQRVVAPIMESAARVVGVGGIIRVANGCRVEKGRVVEVGLSRRALPVFQVVEYARAFLCGRTGFSRFNALMIISGAFGVFERGLTVEIGGYRVDTMGEDMDLVTRLHVHLKESGIGDYAIRFVPDPVCWTEVPDTLRVLARQRRRWQKGSLEVLGRVPRLFLNPRYGAVGLFAYPFLLLFEGWGVLLELAGYAFFALSWLRGVLHWDFLVAFLVVSFLCGMTLSLSGVLLAEMGERRYPRLSDALRLVLFAVIENVGYRQMSSVLRLWGTADYLSRTGGWGRMERQGLSG